MRTYWEAFDHRPCSTQGVNDGAAGPGSDVEESEQLMLFFGHRKSRAHEKYPSLPEHIPFLGAYAYFLSPPRPTENTHHPKLYGP